MIKEYIVELREEEADKLMDEHWVGEFVRCKDCKIGTRTEINGKCVYVTCGGKDHEADWFCADGERGEAQHERN